MARMVSRIKLRAGEPVGLSIYEGPTLFTLPREIRNKIYTCLLLTHSPIQVWRERPNQLHPPDLNLPVIYRLTMGLLSASKQIAREAAAVFYSSNTFVFAGPHTWDPLCSFLLTIGATNRSHLRKLEIGVSQPSRVTIHPDGTLTTDSLDFSWDRKVCSPDNYLRSYATGPNRWGEVEVDDLSPAIEAVFRLLSHSEASLCLTLNMEVGCIPGVTIVYEEGETTWGLELPDHIERMRLKFVSEENSGRSVEVRWRGRLRERLFSRYEGSFGEAGWDLVETDLRSGPIIGTAVLHQDVVFTMRRNVGIIPPG